MRKMTLSDLRALIKEEVGSFAFARDADQAALKEVAKMSRDPVLHDAINEASRHVYSCKRVSQRTTRRRVKQFAEFVRLTLEAAVSPRALPSNVVLALETDDKWYFKLVLLDGAGLGDAQVTEAEVAGRLIGGITVTLEDVWRVNSVWAQHGYGPLLYLLAMQVAGDKGSYLAPHVSGETKKAARVVWQKFKERSDVESSLVSDTPGIRGIGYRSSGDDWLRLTKKYEALGLTREQDADVKFHAGDVVRERAS